MDLLAKSSRTTPPPVVTWAMAQAICMIPFFTWSVPVPNLLLPTPAPAWNLLTVLPDSRKPNGDNPSILLCRMLQWVLSQAGSYSAEAN